jgi:hypothetical protein
VNATYATLRRKAAAPHLTSDHIRRYESQGDRVSFRDYATAARSRPISCASPRRSLSTNPRRERRVAAEEPDAEEQLGSGRSGGADEDAEGEGARQVDHEGAEREVAADPCRDRGADAVPRHGPEPAENGHAEIGEDAYRRASLTPTTATTMPAARL